MTNYNKREDAIEQARKHWTGEGEWITSTETQLLKNLPTVNVRENVKGKWIKHNLKNQNIPWGYDCSVCGEWFVIDKNVLNKYKFCPNCGAQMMRSKS